MTAQSGTSAPAMAKVDRRLAILLAMAMFVLVVDTSVMNVSIASVVHDLHTTVSGVQSAIALEALVSAAFILIGSKVGDLIGRKRAYVLGLLGCGIGALAMALAQGLTALAVGIGASLSNAVSGFVVQWFGYGTGFLFLTAVATCALLFFALLMPETRRGTASGTPVVMPVRA